MYTIEWRVLKPNLYNGDRPGSVVMKLRLTHWELKDNKIRPQFKYENIIFTPHFRDYLEITRNWDLFFNAEITTEIDPADRLRKEFRQHGLKILNKFTTLNYG